MIARRVSANRRSPIRQSVCNDWAALQAALEDAHTRLKVESGENLWFRGVREARHALSPSLMRITEGLTTHEHDSIERNLFFEFQARAAELRARGLTDWEYLFFGRHYDVPTRVLDWTDTFGVALYFAVEGWSQRADLGQTVPKDRLPAVWIVNPYHLNERNFEERDITLPKYLGWFRGRYWDFGELLAEGFNWSWRRPVAIYPAQINDRVRAQRGWFTIHGDDRRPLDEQSPQFLSKIILTPACVENVRALLHLFGLHRFSIYTDLGNLALWISEANSDLAKIFRGAKRPHRQTVGAKPLLGKRPSKGHSSRARSR
jgi:hypothetical protein